jgi:hypothetical protein
MAYRAKNDNIGHTAHFGGAIEGLITLATSPHLIVENTMMVILLTLPIVVLFMAKMGKI